MIVYEVANERPEGYWLVTDVKWNGEDKYWEATLKQGDDLIQRRFPYYVEEGQRVKILYPNNA